LFTNLSQKTFLGTFLITLWMKFIHNDVSDDVGDDDGHDVEDASMTSPPLITMNSTRSGLEFFWVLLVEFSHLCHGNQ
jgi:hypothetical protein